MTDHEIIELVGLLNDHISVQDDCPDHSFSFCTTSYSSVIMFNDFILWSSEDDGREYNEEYNQEPLELCIKRLFNEYLEDINKYKFKRLKKWK